MEALQSALQMAEEVSNQLWGAARTLAWVLLKPEVDPQDRTAKAPPEVGNLVEQWGVKRRYWAQLEVHFRRTLEALPQDRDAALSDWQQTLRQTAWAAFNGIAEDLAGDPTALKAVVKAEGQLAGGLAKLFKPDAALAHQSSASV